MLNFECLTSEMVGIYTEEMILSMYSLMVPNSEILQDLGN